MRLLNRLAMMAVATGMSFVATPRAQAQPRLVQECPHYWGSTHGGPLALPETVSVAGATTNVPEYNDCQRFLRRDSSAASTLRYTKPIQVVWIRYSIRAWMSSRHPLPPNPGPFRDLLRGVSKLTEITTVGVVFSGERYDELGMHPGYSCIVLKYDRTPSGISAASYQSWMVGVASPDACSGDLFKLDPARATALLVTSNPPMGTPRGPDAVPEVARWDWDERRGVQYVSLWCPTGWCDFHKYPLAPSASYAVPAGMTANRSVIRQKGWYDEQYLMDAPAAGTGPTSAPFPTHSRGTVFPVPGLATRTMSHYRAHWRQVAWVSLNPANTAYQAKYAFDMDAAPPNGTLDNRVSMCFERSADRAMAMGGNRAAARLLCGPDLPAQGCTVDVQNKGLWFARITSGSGTIIKTYCVMYRPAPAGVKMSGTARWRWSLKDETIWISCPSGCCETDAIGP